MNVLANTFINVLNEYLFYLSDSPKDNCMPDSQFQTLSTGQMKAKNVAIIRQIFSLQIVYKYYILFFDELLTEDLSLKVIHSYIQLLAFKSKE